MTTTEAHIEKLNAAYRAGHSGETAVSYADLIPGETVEEAKAGADKLARVITAMTPKRREAAPLNGHDDDDSDQTVARSEFADYLGGRL